MKTLPSLMTFIRQNILLIIVLSILPVAVFSSCAAITKHGPVKSEQRSVAAFTRIHAESAFELDFTTDNTCAVTVEAPDDVLPKIRTEVRNGTLCITLDGEVNNLEQPMKVHLKGVSLEAAELEGACGLDLNGPLNGSAFRLDLEGASSFRGTLYMKAVNVDMEGASTAEIGGVTNNFTVNVAGACTLKAEKLSSAETIVKAEGASNAFVQADTLLHAEAEGASSISYKGSPSKVEVSSDGASNIRRE